MPQYAEGINPEIMKWAREEAGYSVEDIARVIKKPAELIEQWESDGPEAPTYIQLEKLAYTHYNVPIGVFFFPEIPDISSVKKSFRTLPDYEIHNMQPNTFRKFKDAKYLQYSLIELNDGTNPAEKCIFKNIHLNKSMTRVESAAQKVKSYLGINIDKQKAYQTRSKAMAAYRDLIQDFGIYIFKDSFKEMNVSGFCIYDEEFPVIYINNSNASSRQAFSLIHELAHILLQNNGITKLDRRYISDLDGRPQRIEAFCNAFASEFLVPDKDVTPYILKSDHSDEHIEEVAQIYNVSREVILRKYLDRKFISQKYYLKKKAEWDQQFFERRETRRKTKKGGGDWYNSRGSYLGKKFLNLVFEKYHQNKISYEQIGEFLNVKPKNVAGLENYAFNKGI